MSVYFVTDRMNGVVKIGYSNAPKRRLAMLRTSSFYDLKLEAVVPGNLDNERQLHQFFSEYHIKREWYKISKEVDGFIALFSIVKKHSDPPKKSAAGTMKLKDYMAQKGLSATSVALKLEVAVSTVTRAAKGELIPNPELMGRIHRFTDGEVSAADFYDLEGKAA